MTVRRVNLVFNEEDHKRLVEKKGNKTWERFVLTLANGDDKQ